MKWADLQTYFADPLAKYIQASTTDRHRGRLEVRQIKGSQELTAYLSVRWPHLQQVAELTRTVTRKGKTTKASPLPHHRPDASAGLPSASAPSEPWSLAHREWIALCARRRLWGRPLLSPLGQCSPSDGGSTQSRDHPHSSLGLVSDRCHQVLFCLSS